MNNSCQTSARGLVVALVVVRLAIMPAFVHVPANALATAKTVGVFSENTKAPEQPKRAIHSNLPPRFEEIRGLADEQNNFIFRSRDYSASVKPTEVSFRFVSFSQKRDAFLSKHGSPTSYLSADVVRMTLQTANPTAMGE